MIPAATRAIPIAIGGGLLSIRSHYHVSGATEPAVVRSYLESNVTHIHSGLVAEQQDQEQFYRGNDQGWGSILQNLDAHRSVTDSILVDAVLLPDENRKTVELFMLKGSAGNGKTVALKRVAWETAVTYGCLAIYVDTPAGLRLDPIQEMYALTGKRAILFVDHVALVRHEIRELLNAARGICQFGAEHVAPCQFRADADRCSIVRHAVIEICWINGTKGVLHAVSHVPKAAAIQIGHGKRRINLDRRSEIVERMLPVGLRLRGP
jgi:hypothetical protein